jgi:bacteriocin-like protein
MGDEQDRGLSEEELQAVSGGTTQDMTADQLDTMGELSAEQQLQLQQSMEQMTKSTSTLSNIMKKQADTSSQIISNLK